ncbi:MAG: septum formation protein Maf [Acidobacteriota bacterium]|nr:septum formation protein Maf [Acidobacteriota bacterium]
MPLILASGSPQRRAILAQLGVDFTVVVSEVDELEQGQAELVAVENARRKALAVAGQRAGDGAERVVPSRRAGDEPPETVVGVDTVVERDGRLYGKPADRDEAAATLRALAGAAHRVVSGVCVIEAGAARTATAVTDVRFRPLADAALRWYLDTGEWRGRAGGYAIQGRGAALVESIRGDYLNVVGLPVATLLDLLPSLLFSPF